MDQEEPIEVQEWSCGTVEWDGEGDPKAPGVAFELLPTEGNPEHEGCRRLIFVFEDEVEIRRLAAQLVTWCDELWPTKKH